MKSLSRGECFNSFLVKRGKEKRLSKTVRRGGTESCAGKGGGDGGIYVKYTNFKPKAQGKYPEQKNERSKGRSRFIKKPRDVISELQRLEEKTEKKGMEGGGKWH